MKLAHLADLHLGFRQFDRQTPRGGNQREADVAEAFRRAVDDVLEQRPDLILLAGDVFHSVRPTNPAILFCFQQLQRVRVELPGTPVVLIAGNHDTPRSSETGTILRLYQALGVEVVTDQARRVVFPKLDTAVLAVPHQALIQADRPALRPEPGATINLLLLHGEVEGVIGEDRSYAEYGGALVTRQELGARQWDYVALGHYHVCREVAANAWYAGSLEYVSPNPWGELREEADRQVPGKGYLLVDLPAARPVFRPIAPPRRLLDLPAIHGAGLGPKDLDALIAERVAQAQPAIDEQVVRLVVYDVARATARDLDHAAIRAYKARALNFHLDVRRPAERRAVGAGAPGRRQTLPEVVREFLARRPLDADLDRGAFVALGLEYLERAGREDEP
ncbi:MAG TPA: DNA repair exonuclease [Gemmatimonadales bacterium]|nr:DNA repair exonuclease [Gemmatimonadales bacterium]